MTASNGASMRFRDKAIQFANGSSGVNIAIPSASPVNYHQVIFAPDDMQTVMLDGKLFVPPAGKRAGNGKLPLVIIVPGSLGIAPSHLAHAETITNHGIAAFVLDSFGGRDVTSTVANQTQFSFAASAYDVLAAWAVLAALAEIDGTRIGAQGHSRGGSAVLTAATRRFADAVVGKGRGLIGILAAYPWCGHQFLDPRVGTTEVRVLMGDADEWCSRCRCRDTSRRYAWPAPAQACVSSGVPSTASIVTPPSWMCPTRRSRRRRPRPISPTTALSFTR